MKKRIYTTFLIVGVVLLGITHKTAAQDIHYTQFGMSPINLNPGFTGLFNGDYRFNFSGRNQWRGAENLVGYNTFTGVYDQKITSKKASTRQASPWRAGFLLNYDRAGWSRLSNISLNLTGSYLLTLGKVGYLSFGVLGGYNQRQFSTSDLTWDNQYYNRQYNPGSSPKDALAFDETIFYPLFSSGVVYHRQKQKSRSALDVGLSAHNINRPKKSFHGAPEVRREVRYVANVSTNQALNKHFDLLADVMYQMQGPHAELLVGVGGRLYVIQKKTKQLALQAGLTYRNGDAFSPNMGMLYNNWRVSVNFDTNVSNFRTASNRIGGPEIHVTYIFAKTPIVKYCPLCPLQL